jgi:hypothetical protein
MSDVKVPKSMTPEAVVFAYRHGVVQGMRMRGWVIPRQGHGYVIAPSNVLRLADRVRREWMRRHPATEFPEAPAPTIRETAPGCYRVNAPVSPTSGRYITAAESGGSQS